MISVFQLALRYIQHHRFKSMLMVFCIVLTLLMPIALSILLNSFNRQIVARADATPLLIGAKGSRVDLTMHALYFQTRAPGIITGQDTSTVEALGQKIPLHIRFSARNYPVVGTTLDYFEFRNIGLDRGDGLTRLGDCVLGSNVANKLGLEPGDQLLTDPENVFGLVGKEPLKMRIMGVLENTESPDDDAVFTDIKTAWVIEGLIHGHENAAQIHPKARLNSDDEDTVVADSSVRPYLEITDDNIGSFHFHGAVDEFPVTAMIVVPQDEKAEALLLGRFQRNDATAQMSEPLVVVRELMTLVFRVRKFFTANAILVAVSTAALLVLVVMLSMRLRKDEMETMFKIGCGKATMAWLVAAELFIVFAVAALLIIAGVLWVQTHSDDLVRSLLSRS